MDMPSLPDISMFSVRRFVVSICVVSTFTSLQLFCKSLSLQTCSTHWNASSTLEFLTLIIFCIDFCICSDYSVEPYKEAIHNLTNKTLNIVHDIIFTILLLLSSVNDVVASGYHVSLVL